MSDAQWQFLVQVKQQRVALLFVNYLSSISIQAKSLNENDGVSIYCASVQYQQARQAFEAFVLQPDHPKYQQAAWQHGTTSELQTDQQSVVSSFSKDFLAHAGPVTLVIFALCWLVFLASLAGAAQGIFNQIKFYPQLSMHALMENPLRLLGPIFFHFSWLHLVFNTMWWWQLGGSIERILGKGALILLLLLSGIFSNIGQFIVSGPEFGGLSGVVYGLVGFVWWMGWLAPQKGLFLSKSLVGFLLFWILLGYADLLPMNIANTAHLLGLICGCLFAYLYVNIYNRSIN
jgi:GlpG protein